MKKTFKVKDVYLMIPLFTRRKIGLNIHSDNIETAQTKAEVYRKSLERQLESAKRTEEFLKNYK